MAVFLFRYPKDTIVRLKIELIYEHKKETKEFFMKKINLIIVSSIAALSLAACGKAEEPVVGPEPDTNFWASNGVTGEDNGNNSGSSSSSSDNQTSFWDSYQSQDSGQTSFWDDPANQPQQSSNENILPQEYSVLIVGHQWVQAYDDNPVGNYYLVFDENGEWKAFDYDNNGWVEQNYGYVYFDYDAENYVIYSKKNDLKYDSVTYEDGVLYGGECCYYEDAQMPATAEEGASEYARFAGIWNVEYDNGDYYEYYELFYDGSWDYYYYDGNNWLLTESGYIEYNDSYVEFYNQAGLFVFEAFEFDDGNLRSQDFNLRRRQ